MSHDHACAVEEGEEICMKYAERLHHADPNIELLRFYRPPTDGEEWRAIRFEFFTRFGAEGSKGEECIGNQALAQFYTNFAAALRQECRHRNLPLD